jgi:hypothetical protein
VQVTGDVELGDATLDLDIDPGFTPQAGEPYILIANDGSDAVSGEFAGLAEGAIVSTDFGGSGLTARITYAGGDGNDVAIVVDGPFTYTAADGGDSAYVVRRVGGNIQLVEGGTVIDSRPIQGVTTYTLEGEDGFIDTLDVQATGFANDFTGTIVFNGGAGGPDRPTRGASRSTPTGRGAGRRSRSSTTGWSRFRRRSPPAT